MTVYLPESDKDNPIESIAYIKRTLFTLFVFIAALLVSFYGSVWSMISIWIRSETFTHGFLIFPITVWMMWQKKELIYQSIDRPAFLPVLPLLLSGGVWLLANLVDVLVVQHFALVGMLISGVWMILGSRTFGVIIFPLAYLFFLVPFGEGLVPSMMEYTATFTVKMVELTGIPVYREGMSFILPSGSWSVVEACSGVRYLIASLALGCLYAYLNYRSPWRRAAFILASIAVPIIANGLRAYLIVMLGHLSDMEIATGVDHLIYGWVFFGVVMFLLFWVGSFWREDVSKRDSESTKPDHFARSSLSAVKPPLTSLNRVGVLALLAILIWPALDMALEREQVIATTSLLFPDQVADWSKAPRKIKWEPLNDGADKIAHASYAGEQNSEGVMLVVHQFTSQSQGDELVPGRELLTEWKAPWRIIAKESGLAAVGGVIQVNEAVLRHKFGDLLLVWSWYRVGSSHLYNPYQVKLREVKQKLTLSRQDGARIFIATRMIDGHQGLGEARALMDEFLKAGLSDLEHILDDSVGL